MSLVDHQAIVDRIARAPTDIVSPSDRDAAIGIALLRYSQDRPLIRVADVTHPGGYFLPLPAGWSLGESLLQSIETPIGSNPPSTLEAGDYQVLLGVGSETIQLSGSIPAGQTARIRFYGPHTVSATEDTVPPRDREALACWAAALLCDQVAAHHAEDRAPTISADRVDYTNPAKEWGRRADACRKRYYELLGIDVSGMAGGSGAPVPKPAGGVVNLDTPDSRMRPYLSRRLWR